MATCWPRCVCESQCWKAPHAWAKEISCFLPFFLRHDCKDVKRLHTVFMFPLLAIAAHLHMFTDLKAN